VHVVGDGALGLATIEQEGASAVFTDLGMPVLDGRHLIDALRSRPEFAAMPIVAMTAANLAPEELEELLARGATDVLAKPFGPSELRAKLAQVLAMP
jgi:CheY-like chemotaxis protein